MVSFVLRAPSGVAGDVTRTDKTVVEPGQLNPAAVPTAYGQPVKLVAGRFNRIAASDPATVFSGVLARIAPGIAGDTTQAFGPGVPNATSTQGVVIEGYVNVLCPIGTPVRGGAVYMRVAVAAGRAIGDFEATADGVNNVLLPNVIWAVDGKDASNVAEIRIR